MEFTADQSSAIESITTWLKLAFNSDIIYTLGGFAGTGKTTVLSEIRKQLDPTMKVAFCCFTGKATSVLSRKLGIVNANDKVSTIHSLIYEPVIDPDTKEVIEWRLRVPADVKVDIMIIDEASMVSEELIRDLQTFKKPMIACGDHGQLPPVSGSQFNLMNDPLSKLETIHRQEADNPIIKLSMMARLDGFIPYQEFGKNVVKDYKSSGVISKFINNSGRFENTVILCAYNKTRLTINTQIRKHFGYSSVFPMPGERVICLRNNKKKSIFNGMQGTVQYCEPDRKGKHLEMEIKMDGSALPYHGIVSCEGFSNPSPTMEEGPISVKTIRTVTGTKKVSEYPDYFDYGYCITTHKSQGSEWERVMIIEEVCKMWDHKKWLYTAVTRSKDQLLIVR